MHFKYKTQHLKIKKKIDTPCRCSQKKPEVAILIADKVDFGAINQFFYFIRTTGKIHKEVIQS